MDGVFGCQEGTHNTLTECTSMVLVGQVCR